jgi:hypothetical protein
MYRSCFYYCIGIILILCTLNGCWSQNVPEGLPKLYQCTLTLYINNIPLDDATVMIIPIEPEKSIWVAGGVSNSHGMVKPMIQGKYSGVPEGKFKVTVTKRKIEIDEQKVADILKQEKKMEERTVRAVIAKNASETINLVHPNCAQIHTTPLEIEVKKGKNSFVLNVPPP